MAEGESGEYYHDLSSTRRRLIVGSGEVQPVGLGIDVRPGGSVLGSMCILVAKISAK